MGVDEIRERLNRKLAQVTAEANQDAAELALQQLAELVDTVRYVPPSKLTREILQPIASRTHALSALLVELAPVVPASPAAAHDVEERAA